MSGINPYVLQQIRATAAAFLSEKCTLQQGVQHEGEFGDAPLVWVNASVDVPCRLVKQGNEKQPGAVVTAGQDTLDEMYKLSLPRDTSVEVDYRVLHGDVTYEVVRIESALTDAVFTQAIVRRKR